MKGEPVTLRGKKRLINVTCTACMSVNGVEALRFFDAGGTKNEMYAEYFGMLIK